MPSLSIEDKKLVQRCLSDNPQLKALFDRLAVMVAPSIERMVQSADGIWVNNRDVQRQIDAALLHFSKSLAAFIGTQTEWAWNLANIKNDALVNDYLRGIKIPTQVKAKYLNRNVEALQAFQKRKVDGMGLSDRVWKIRDQSEKLIESYLENGLSTGKSAAEISRDVRQFLQDPDALFRRIRNSKGQLVPSAPMKANRPGTGVYNSAYQNALRLTATETNMAYRNSDHERWRQIDFILGFEVITSEVHLVRMPQGDICDVLKGKYPKTFKFTGWHPRCFCQAVAIKLSKEQFMEYLRLNSSGDVSGANAIIEGASIKGVDGRVAKYVTDNSERFKGWKSEPYWLRDNFSYSKDGYLPKMGLNLPKAKPIKNYIPAELVKGSKYLKGTNIEFKNEFFAKVNEDLPLNTVISRTEKGSYFSPKDKKVVIADGSRNKASLWHRESVVYHEFGHAIDDQIQLSISKEVADMMGKWRQNLMKTISVVEQKKRFDFTNRKFYTEEVTVSKLAIADICDRLLLIARRLYGVDEKYFAKRGISKADAIEQISAIQDTMMALNPNYGFGHTKTYYNRPFTREAEFIAHAFENAYAGNRFFEKYLPDLYQEMSEWAKGINQ